MYRVLCALELAKQDSVLSLQYFYAALFYSRYILNLMQSILIFLL